MTNSHALKREVGMKGKRRENTEFCMNNVAF
jgi:hypothetical protein